MARFVARISSIALIFSPSMPSIYVQLSSKTRLEPWTDAKVPSVLTCPGHLWKLFYLFVLRMIRSSSTMSVTKILFQWHWQLLSEVCAVTIIGFTRLHMIILMLFSRCNFDLFV